MKASGRKTTGQTSGVFESGIIAPVKVSVPAGGGLGTDNVNIDGNFVYDAGAGALYDGGGGLYASSHATVWPEFPDKATDNFQLTVSPGTLFGGNDPNLFGFSGDVVMPLFSRPVNLKPVVYISAESRPYGERDMVSVPIQYFGWRDVDEQSICYVQVADIWSGHANARVAALAGHFGTPLDPNNQLFLEPSSSYAPGNDGMYSYLSQYTWEAQEGWITAQVRLFFVPE